MTRDDPASGPEINPGPANARRFRKADLRRVGTYLRDQRIASGVSLRRLSELSGVSVAAIRTLEGGQSNPSLGTVVAVVEALGVMLDHVIEAARSNRSNVTVTPATDGDAYLSDGFAEAALSAHIVTLPVKSMHPNSDGAAKHPSLGVVIKGAVLAAVDTTGASGGANRGGTRVRLEAGDNYHAQPGSVQSLANAGGRDARVLVVLDTRRDGGPTSS